MTRIKRLKEHEYDPIHLVGDFYLVRYRPHKPLRIITRIKRVTVNSVPSVPDGEFR